MMADDKDDVHPGDANFSKALKRCSDAVDEVAPNKAAGKPNKKPK